MPFNDLCFLSWSLLELLHEPFFFNFLCCTAASGPYLETNRKDLILHGQNIDHGLYVKCLNGGATAHTVLTELDDQKLKKVVMWLLLRARLHIFVKHFYYFKSVINAFQNLLSPK